MLVARSLFESLHRHGFATDYRSEQARLRETVITNIVKCVPPANRPLSGEKRNCERFLARELESFLPNRRSKNRVILCLGRDAYESVHRLLELPTMPFAHGIRSPDAGERVHPNELSSESAECKHWPSYSKTCSTRSLLTLGRF